MAISNFNTQLSTTSDAIFRTTGAALKAALAAVGLVQTSDTGQINWTTVTAPVSSNAYIGYEIWRLNDALQSTYPVFFKIEWACGSSGTTYLTIGLTVGTGSNGSGTLINPGPKLTTSYNSNASSAQHYLCGDTDRFILYLAAGASAYGGVFFVERFKDVYGNNNTVGVCYGIWAGSTTYTSTSLVGTYTACFGIQAYEFGLGSQPIAVTQSLTLIGAANTTVTSTQFGNNVVLLPVTPLGSQIHNPLTQVWVFCGSDISNLSNPSIVQYGTARSMLALNANNYVIPGTPIPNGSSANGRPIIAYW